MPSARAPIVLSCVAALGCAASKPSATPIGTCSASSASGSSVAANAPPEISTQGVPKPEQVCERVRRIVVASGAVGAEIDEGVRECLEELVELRTDDPDAYACEARCLMIVPGLGGDVSCGEICDAHAEDSCVDMRKEDTTLSDAQVAACRDRIARIRATTDAKTMLCALGCAGAANTLRGMDECFVRCL